MPSRYKQVVCKWLHSYEQVVAYKCLHSMSKLLCANAFTARTGFCVQMPSQHEQVVVCKYLHNMSRLCANAFTVRRSCVQMPLQYEEVVVCKALQV